MFGECCHDRQNEFNQNFVGENDINMDIDVNMAGGNINMGIGSQQMMGPSMMGTVQSPIVEPMQERVVHRTIMHEVPHVCPRRTKIINHHVFRHTYRPTHTCCEENTCTNIQCGSCCQFR